MSKIEPWKIARYELPIFEPAEVRNLPGEEICPIINGSEITITIPPIRNANINATKGSRVLFLKFFIAFIMR
jgi:hypothetical protein